MRIIKGISIMHHHLVNSYDTACLPQGVISVPNRNESSLGGFNRSPSGFCIILGRAGLNLEIPRTWFSSKTRVDGHWTWGSGPYQQASGGGLKSVFFFIDSIGRCFLFIYLSGQTGRFGSNVGFKHLRPSP